jgi:hypothetical protein
VRWERCKRRGERRIVGKEEERSGDSAKRNKVINFLIAESHPNPKDWPNNAPCFICSKHFIYTSPPLSPSSTNSLL